MMICKNPGKTNLGRQELDEGWLGTTNDYTSYAHGQYDSLDEARNFVNDQGFTETPETEGEDYDLEDTDVIERWVRPEGNFTNWETEDWLFSNCRIYDHWNEQTLDEAVAQIENEAKSERINLEGDVRECLLDNAKHCFENHLERLNYNHMKTLFDNGEIEFSLDLTKEQFESMKSAELLTPEQIQQIAKIFGGQPFKVVHSQNSKFSVLKNGCGKDSWRSKNFCGIKTHRPHSLSLIFFGVAGSVMQFQRLGLLVPMVQIFYQKVKNFRNQYCQRVFEDLARFLDSGFLVPGI